MHPREREKGPSWARDDVGIFALSSAITAANARLWRLFANDAGFHRVGGLQEANGC